MTIETSLTDLEALARQYPAAEQNQLYEIAAERAIKGERALLGLAALAADLSIDDILNAGLEPNLNPLLLKAISRKYDEEALQVMLDRLRDMDLTSDALVFDGDLGQIKGLLFEQLVEDRLNKGETLGELRLEEGQYARLAPKEDQEGWDLIIFNEDGTTHELLSLKATEAMRRIKEALEKHDDIRVVTTSEIDGRADEILTTDISNAELELILRNNLDEPGELAELGEGALGNIVDNSAEILLDSLPIVSGIIVVVTEGRAVLMGSAQLGDSIRRGAKRLGKASAFTTVGALMTAASVPGVAVTPALLAARVWASRLGNRATMGEIAKEHADTLMALTPDSE